MSFTSFTSKATFEVPEGFNMDSFLLGLSQLCVDDDNFIVDSYGLDPENEELCDLDFHNYVSQDGTEITVHLDTEEPGFGDSEVFDWLTDRFVPVMTSDFMRIESVTMDSRDGNSCHIDFQNKNGDLIDVDVLLQHYLKTQPV
jgi:hypothetical protein